MSATPQPPPRPVLRPLAPLHDTRPLGRRGPFRDTLLPGRDR